MQSSSRKTILVVEDDEDMLEVLALLLQDEGYTVLLANSGESALVLLQQEKPDLIISDVTMPGMDGFDLYEQIVGRGEQARIPFIFLTARGKRSDVRKGMELGADDYLVKPFEPEELLNAIKVRLERATESRAALDVVTAGLQEQIIRTLIHEFRTPLALVVGYTDLLEASGQEINEEDLQAILQGLHSGSERLKGLVEDFLFLSRLSTGSMAGEIGMRSRETVNPDEAIDLVLEEFDSQAAAKEVTFEVARGAQGLTIAVSHLHLVEIIRRLVDNAIKFSKKGGGNVTVTTGREGAYWVMEIADDGIGIPSEALRWIFEAFRQVDRDKMEQQGAGVGLTIVQGLVEAYGGRVAVESTLGRGSTFTVRLPLVGS